MNIRRAIARFASASIAACRWPHLLGAVLAALLIGVGLPARAATDPSIVSIAWYVDTSDKMNLDQVRTRAREGAMHALAGQMLAHGYTGHPVWLRLLVHAGPQPQQAVLMIGPPNLDDVRIFDADGAEQRAGDIVAHAHRGIEYRGNAFAVNLPAGRSEIYVRVRTSSSMIVLAKLMTGTAFEDFRQRDDMALGAVIGICLAITAINLVNWVVRRNRLFGYFAGVILLIALNWASNGGVLGQVFLATLPEIDSGTQGLFLGLYVGSAQLFYARFFELQTRMPLVYRYYQAQTGIALLTALSAPLGYFLHFAPWLVMATLIGQMLAVYAGYRLVVQARREQDRLMLLLVAAYAVFCVPNILNILLTLGLLPPTEAVLNSVRFDSMIHALLAHTAIALRIREMEQARAAAEAEARRESLARAEQADLLASVAIEVGTPIAAIRASAAALQAQDPAPAPEREARYERITAAISRAHDLVDLALERSQVGVADTQPVFASVQPTALCADTRRYVGPQAEARVQIACPPSLPAVIGDARMLRFALANVIDNALKYSPPGSRVDVVVESETYQDQPGVVFQVIDDGSGIQPGMEAEIFRKYKRGAETGTAGLGLGLYLVDAIVRRHAGHIVVTRHLDRGACFAIWLPAYRG